MSRLGFPQLLKCHLPARDEPLHQIKINSRNILVFLKLRFWPQAPTESSAQFQPLLAQGAELRVGKGRKEFWHILFRFRPNPRFFSGPMAGRNHTAWKTQSLWKPPCEEAAKVSQISSKDSLAEGYYLSEVDTQACCEPAAPNCKKITQFAHAIQFLDPYILHLHATEEKFPKVFIVDVIFCKELNCQANLLLR